MKNKLVPSNCNGFGILIFVFSFLPIFTSFAQDQVFKKIENKTWFEKDEFTGSTIVLYKSANSLLKAIRQVNGSGVPVVQSEIFDLEIKNDTLYLYNGLNLNTSEKLSDLKYTFDNQSGILMHNGNPLEIIREKSILYAWTNSRKSVYTEIDVSMLAQIKIGKKEIYKDEDLIKTLIEK